MDGQWLKDKIKTCKLKISDMEQQVVVLKAKIEREKQVLQRYQESFKEETVQR